MTLTRLTGGSALVLPPRPMGRLIGTSSKTRLQYRQRSGLLNEQKGMKANEIRSVESLSLG